jgi:hypothetical protein
MTPDDASNPTIAALSREQRALCATQARWLDACAVFGTVGVFALGLSALCLAVGAGVHSLRALAYFALALAPCERYLALRVRFDRGLFADLADARITDLRTLDEALAASGLRKPAMGAPRTLAERIAGTKRLWRAHAVVAATQLLLSLAMLAMLL